MGNVYFDNKWTQTDEMTGTRTRCEEVYILYGSQSGTAEGQAFAFSEELPTKLSPQSITSLAGKEEGEVDEITLVPIVMKLDEFLELKQARWTRLVFIFVSSYGGGGAPKGGKKFRELCNALVAQYEYHPYERNGPPLTKDEDKPLRGLHFALCGFCRFGFKTYMKNPGMTDRGLRAAGAARIGNVCRADSYGTGEHSSEAAVERWKEEMWKPLAEFLVKEPISDEELKGLHERTADLKY